MLRRDFLVRAVQAGTLLPLASSGLFARPLHGLFANRSAAGSDRVLVLINLNGGNDGLNTVIPIESSIYYNARPAIAIPKAQALQIETGIGFHPSMTSMRSLYGDGRLAVVSSVGYDNQDRSHFRSTDIYHTGSDADQLITTGWLGRYLEQRYPDYPSVLPDAPFAMQVSSSATLALQGESGNMGIAIDNPDRFYNLARGLSVEPEPVPATLAGPELEFVRSIIAQSNRYSQNIQTAMLDGSTNVQYGTDSLASQLKVVARLINGGLQTGIYIVSLGGFDTHNAQLPAHAQLLARLSNAVSNFLADVNAAGNGDRVALMTYSEFGRRVNENGSQGTDHGAAAPMFVAGKMVKGGVVLGGAANLTELDNRGDVKNIYDYRQVYAAVLRDWLGFSQADTNAVLGREFDALPLFPKASVSVDDRASAANALAIASVQPNPVREMLHATVRSASSGRAQVSLVSSTGATLLVQQMTVAPGSSLLALDCSRIPAGSYSLVVDCNGRRATTTVHVIR